MPHSSSGRIGIFHLSLNTCGGAERLALVLSRSLRQAGYSVDLVTTEKPRWGEICRKFDIDERIFDHEIVIPPFVQLPTIYSRFAYWLSRDAILTPLLKNHYDLTITTIETLPIVFSDVLYVHFPDFVSSLDLDIHYRKYSTGGMRAYAYPYRAFTNLFTRTFKMLSNKPVMLTNSKYTRAAIREYLDIDALVVYPPVDVVKYSAVSKRGTRQDIVLTISRLERTKNLHILPRLALKTAKARFIVLGSSDSTSKAYLAEILREAKQLGVSDRIEFVVDAGESEKRELLAKAKIYLHTMLHEHFGMSIVEGMSTGLVPVVHKSGGPWMDILDKTQGLCGYAYSDLDQAAAILNELFENEQRREQISLRAIERAKSFDSQRFVHSMLQIVQRLLELKGPRR